MSDFIAHVRKNGDVQLLRTHLVETAEICASLTEKIGLSSAGRLLGLLHDFGKYSQKFQVYIKSAEGRINPDEDEWVDAGKLRGKIDHSTAGAQLIWQQLSLLATKAGHGSLVGQILSLCIVSHHSGLIDCIDLQDKTTFLKRMVKPEEKGFLEECKESAEKDILDRAFSIATLDLVKEVSGIIKKITLLGTNKAELLTTRVEQFQLGFFTRFLFSCLIDADRLNSAEFEEPTRKIERESNSLPVQWGRAIDLLESQIAQFDCDNYVDELRSEISNNCKARANDKQGIYTLTVPTGGGKTYASLRYALHHAKTHNLDRIIYVIPFTSIIDQNAQAIREILKGDPEVQKWVLEHHSNLEPEKQTWQSKLVSENWDSPIVLTTSVQLLEAMFSGGTKSVRRLHQLAKSVLIFDEIQTLPINCVHMFCNALNFLTQQCRTTAVLCTATQPLLNELKRPELGKLDIPSDNELAGDYQRHYRALQRVEVNNCCKPGGWQADEISALAITQFDDVGSCLVIVNTKAWAQELYQRCETEVGTDSIFHLSTNQYPDHRKQLLDQIKARLKHNQPVLCISTQLIEAGVDVDFGSVIRFLAGLDSIAQAAGRCNRHGKRIDENGEPIKGQVFVVNPFQESTGMLKDIEVGKEKAQTVFNASYDDYLSPDAIKHYFQEYFFNRSDDMAYRLEGDKFGSGESLMNLLGNRDLTKPMHHSSLEKLPWMKQAFMQAGKQFKAIDAPTQAVIVQHDEGKVLIGELTSVAKEFDARRYYELLRAAQKFSVNVFPNIWRKLCDENAVAEIQEGHGIYYLKEEYYSEHFGLSTENVGQQAFLGL